MPSLIIHFKFPLGRHLEELSTTDLTTLFSSVPYCIYIVISAFWARFSSSNLPKEAKEINSRFKIVYQLISSLSDYFLKGVAGRSGHPYTVTSPLKNPIQSFPW